ncbi:MAG: cation:dicarboxylase symporter family transporter [Bacteroidaceae bacterium]|nr:cation:dicarboxylase symporter family transporter [Bacteroidaceae bacterium]
MKKIHIPLLPRIIIAIELGVLLGKFMPESIVRIFATFNDIFGQFLGFLIPLIIIGLVTPAIAEIGKGAGKLLMATAALSYFDTVLAGLLTYGSGRALYIVMDSFGTACNVTGDGAIALIVDKWFRKKEA